MRLQASAPTLLLATVLCGFLLAPVAEAQGFRSILIVQGTFNGVTVEEFADLHEESAYVAEDLGGFVVTRDYQLGGIYGEEIYAELLACAGSVPCLVQTWAARQFDDLLVVNVFRSGSEVHVYYDRVDVAEGRSIARTIAYLPDESAFSHLLAAAHDALRPPTTAPTEPAEVATPETPPEVRRPVTPPPEAPVLTPRQRLGVGLSLGGTALLTGGVLLGFMADATQEELQSRPRPGNEVENLQQQGRAQAALATTALITGGLLIVGGGVLYVTGAERESSSSRSRARLHLDVGPSEAHVGLRGRFR